MPNVAFTRQDLAELLPMYELIADALSGEVEVKKQGEKYLPMPNGKDRSPDNKARYNAYRKRASFYNVTRRTLHGLVGQVFNVDPVIKIPTQLASLQANATGGGVSLTQLAKKAVQFNLAYSRGGIYVDYPTTDGAASVEDVASGKVRPTLYVYAPMSIINWRTTDIGAEEVLSLVVIFETYGVYDDGFETKENNQFRVLYLDETGKYKMDIYREPTPSRASTAKSPLESNWRVHSTYMPTDSAGNRLDRIPFMFFGSENNDANCDNPNFYDLASLNMSHYRVSADYEEACYITGQPTPVLTGLTKEWVDDVLKGSVEFGSRAAIQLPVGGDAKLLQAVESTMLKENLDAKERQMVALGAKLVETTTVQRTATEATLEATSETSILTSSTKNVSEAVTWALKWAARWVGLPDSGIEFTLNTDFDIMQMTEAQRKQLISEWQSGAITFTEMRNGLRKAGIATEDDEVAKAEIASEQADAIATAVAEQSALAQAPGGAADPNAKPAAGGAK